MGPAVVAFPLPRWGARDPHFGLTRSDWIVAAVPGKGRPNPPVRSFRSNGPGRGRRLIDFESARRFVEALRDEQLREVSK